MQVKLLYGRRRCQCFGSQDAQEGQVVEAIPASNLPDYEAKGLLWVDDEDMCSLEGCPGILLHRDDYEVVEEAS